MSFEVIKPGILSTLQDWGRYGYQHIGLTTGGPMDEHAFCWANWLLENEMNMAQIEITWGKLILKAHEPTIIALTGADLKAKLNDQYISPWTTYNISKGDILSFDSPVQGLRAYLAVSGGFNVKDSLGSIATIVREHIGGLANGEPLKEGDLIPFSPSSENRLKRVPKWAIPDYGAPLSLGVMLGYQQDSFSKTALDTFFSTQYEVSQNIDRMGYRLTGTPISGSLNGIISEGIAYGAIQVPQDGQPIILMKDRQTIGGYPKLGCLSALGASQLAQRAPGTSVSFFPMEIEQAEAERYLFDQVVLG